MAPTQHTLGTFLVHCPFQNNIIRFIDHAHTHTHTHTILKIIMYNFLLKRTQCALGCNDVKPQISLV